MSEPAKAGLLHDLIDLKSVFAVKGPLAQSMPAYHLREEQSVLASQIQLALIQEEHCLAEAGTGVGKSLAYLIPGIDWALKKKTRLMVSTHTKALQTQLMQKELPHLLESNLFIRPFKFEICLGAENYICLLRMLRAGTQEHLPGFDDRNAEDLYAVKDWCGNPVSGLRQDCPIPVSDAFWQSTCIINDFCLGRHCQYFSECFLQQARQRQREADVLVANHYLFFSNIAAAGKLLPDFHAVVMDEAHKVEDVASAFLGDTVGEQEVVHLLSEVGRRGKGSFLEALKFLSKDHQEKIRQLTAQIIGQQTAWWKKVGALLSGYSDTLRIQEKPDDLDGPETAAMLELAEVFGEVGKSAESDEENKLLGFYESSLRNTVRVLEEWFERDYADSVYWIQRQKNFKGEYCRINITPLDLSEKLHALLFEPMASVVLTSATLAVNRDFSYFQSRLGIPEAREIVTDSPFSYEDQAAVYLPKNMPDPKLSEKYEDRVQNEVVELIDCFGGGLFVLCTSYRMMRNLKTALQFLTGQYTILTQGEKPPRQLLQLFIKDKNAVMLGVETFWQGVDVPGEALRCVVITRLPFDVPTHPVHQARAEYLNEQGENPFMTYSVPRAVLMLRQGFGRLIRHHHDRGVVAIMDPRVQTRAWGKIFLQALPRCERLCTLEQVREFASEHFPGEVE